MSSSEGKFFSKVKNAFKSDKRDSSTPASPTTPKKTAKPTKTTETTPATKDQENVIDQAYDEGRNFFHRKHKSGASASSGSKSKSTERVPTGATTTTAAVGSTTTDENHKDILKEAYEEGRKLFHFHVKHGKSNKTPTQRHDENFTTGVGAAAVGAGVGAAAATAASTATSGSRTGTSDYSGTDKEVLAESSVGRVVTSPPRRSREPLDHTITGDYANSKKPTDPTVISGGKVDKDHQPGVDDDGEQNYTEGAKTVEGEGKFFDPKDTQGGILAATGVAGVVGSSAVGARKYNEKTKAEYNDLSGLKTKPSAYQKDTQSGGIALDDDFDFQAIKQEAYQEGNKQGRVDFQASTLEKKSTTDTGSGSGAGTAIVGGSSKVDPSKQREIHEENKSAYNPDGVSGILEQNHHTGASNHTNTPTTTSTGRNAVPSNQHYAKDSSTGSVPSNQYDNKHFDSTGISNKGGEKSAVAAGANTTTATGAAAIAGTSALAAGIVAAAGFGSGISTVSDTGKSSDVAVSQSGSRHDNLEDDRKISDLDRQLKQTEDKIDQLKHDPSNASSYAVHQEPIRAPKLQDIGDEDDAVVAGSGTSSKNTGVAATVGATGALGAAAAYLGLKKGTSSASEKEPVSSYGDSKSVPDTSYATGQGTAVQDTAYTQGQAASINDEAYRAGYQQGKDLYEGIDKNSTKHRDALLSGTTSADDRTKTLDPNAGGSAAQTGGLFQSTKDTTIGATAAVAGALGLGAAASSYSSSDKHKDTLSDAYASGKSKGEGDFNATGGYASYGDDITQEAYQAGRDKALYEKNTASRTTGSTTNPGYLAAAGAAVGGAAGAVGAALTGKSDKQRDVDDSLLEDAEKVEPSIAKLPAHRVNKGELNKEETLGRYATVDEKELVNSNDRQLWESEADAYNKQHGFSNRKESLLQEAEDVDPSIKKLPAYKSNQNALKKETTLNEDATLTEKDVVYSNEDRIWERDTDEYNKAHGFSNPKESLLKEAEDVDPSIAKLPAYKSHNKELKKEETLAPDATFGERELVAENEIRDWEKETDDYNKKHGFSNPKESLLQEAEDTDSAIGKLPSHHTNTKELKKEETLSKTATDFEKDLVYTNQDREMEKETDAYNKSHGFSNPKETLLQQAEDFDPAINKLPAHRTNKTELKKEESLSNDADFVETELVETNQMKEWERETEDYNVKHGFANPKESLLQEAEDADSNIHKLPAYGSTGKVPTNSKDAFGSKQQPYSSTAATSGNDSKDINKSSPSPSSSSSKGYLAAAGAALGGAVGYAFSGKDSKKLDVDDSLVEDAEKVDPKISSIPAHKVNERELKAETSLGPGVTFEEKEAVNANNRKLWENETDNYNKAHGFDPPKESLIKEAEDHDSRIAKLPAYSGSERAPTRSSDISQGAIGSSSTGAANVSPHVDKNVSSSPSSKGYLAAAGAALGGAVGYAFGGKDSKKLDVDDSLVEDAEKVDPEIASLPAHKVNEAELKRETSFGNNATIEEKEAVNANERKLWGKETDEYNKKRGYANPTESLIQEAVDVDPSIKKIPAYKANKDELKRETSLGAGANFAEKETVYSNDRQIWENETEEYNKKHGFTGPTDSLLAVAEDADPSIAKLPSYKGDTQQLSIVQEGNDVQKLPDNYQTARPTEIKKSLADSSALGAATGAATGIAAVGLTETELYQEGYQKGKFDFNSTVYSEARIPTHQRTISGASYNATKPIGESELPEPNIDNSYTNKQKHESSTLPIAAAAAAVGAGVGSATAAVHTKNGLDNSKDSASSLDPSLKKEFYNEGYDQGKHPYLEKEKGNEISTGGNKATNISANAGSDVGIYAAAAGAGAGAGLVAANVNKRTNGVNSTLDPTLKKQFYDEGYSHGQNANLGKQQYNGAGDSARGLDSNLQQSSYAAGYSQGSKGLGNTGTTPVGSTVNSHTEVDAKLKQDLYEHGYAKGSTEAKQDRDAQRSASGAYGNPIGTNHREAAVIGSMAGLAAGAAGAVGAAAAVRGGNGSQKQAKPSEGEYVGASGKAKGADNNNGDESLLVEVIGIEDKDEALRTAKKASKKLDDKGVDLSSGKLVINANTKEIYKDDTFSASGTSGSSDLGQKSKDITSSPSTGRHDEQHSNNPFVTSNASADSSKLDTYQQTEAAKKRFSEAARKNVSSTQKHPQGSSSGLTPIEIAAMSAGVGGGVAAAEYESGSTPKNTSVSQDAPNVTPTQKHRHPDVSDHSGQPPIKKQDTNDSPSVASSSASTTPSATTATDDDEIFVNVKGIKDNALATKIARTAVARLQKTHAGVVANVKELQVDASSGIVRDEHGHEIAQYPDLSIDRINSGKRVASHETKSPVLQGSNSPVQGTKSPSQVSKSPATTQSHHHDHHHHQHNHAYGQHLGQTSPSSTRASKNEYSSGSSGLGGGALAGAASGGLAAAAAAAAIRKSHESERPVVTAGTPPPPPPESNLSSGDRGVGESVQSYNNKSAVNPNGYSSVTHDRLHASTSHPVSSTSGTTPSTSRGVADTTATSSGQSTIPGFNFAGIPGFTGAATSSSGQSKDSSNSSTSYSQPTTSAGAGTISNPTGYSSGTKSSSTNGYEELSKAPKYPSHEPVSPSLNTVSQQHNVPGLSGSTKAVNADVGNYALGDTSRSQKEIPSSTDGNSGFTSKVKSAEVPKTFVNPEVPSLKLDSSIVDESTSAITGGGNLNTKSIKPISNAGARTTGTTFNTTTGVGATDPEEEQNSSFFSFAETSTYSMPGTWTT